MSKHQILSVGQCAADHHMISQFLGRSLGAEVSSADSAREAIDAVRKESYHLVLVNRVFDRDGNSGLELIQALKADPATSKVPVMLVSNHPDAQQAAEQAGAYKGFGKADLGSDRALEAIRQSLDSLNAHQAR